VITRRRQTIHHHIEVMTIIRRQLF